MERTEAETRQAQLKQLDAKDKQRAAIESSISSAKRAARDKGDDGKARQAKTRQKKLDERWGLEKSAKGTRFKLNRDLGGYHASMRGEIEVLSQEREVWFKLQDPAEMRVQGGALVVLENTGVGYSTAAGRVVTKVLDGVNLTIHPGSRTALVGVVSRRFTSRRAPRGVESVSVAIAA